MNKRVVSIVIFLILLCTAGISFAQTVKIDNPLESETFDELLLSIAAGVGALVASLGVIMIIIAGILYLTSAGSPEKVGTAKKALMYAFVGIAIGLAATTIVEVIKWTIGAPTT